MVKLKIEPGLSPVLILFSTLIIKKVRRKINILPAKL